MKNPVVYILANKKNGTLYIGVTSNLSRRMYEHKKGALRGFSKKYGCKILVFVEAHETMESAILREKQIKGGSRKDKLALIEKENSLWQDLSDDFLL